MRLADAPEDTTPDAARLVMTPGLLLGDPRLEALFAPFRECVVLHEALMREGSAARATRLLMTELDADRFDEVCAISREVCSEGAFTEKPSERDDVVAGVEWQEGGGALSIAAYRLLGGSTSLHVTMAKVAAPEAPMAALRESPLAFLADLVEATSFVRQVSCSRTAKEAPRWYVQAALRDLRRFEEIAPHVVALGFEKRRGKYWRGETFLQATGKDRWVAALPGIDLEG